MNPLLMDKATKKKNAKIAKGDDDVSEGVWSDEEDEKEKQKKLDEKNKKDSNLGKRKKRDHEDGLFDDTKIEEVP